MERMSELRIRVILPGSDLREKSDLDPTFEKEPDPTSFLPSQ